MSRNVTCDTWTLKGVHLVCDTCRGTHSLCGGYTAATAAQLALEQQHSGTICSEGNVLMDVSVKQTSGSGAAGCSPLGPRDLLSSYISP